MRSVLVRIFSIIRCLLRRYADASLLSELRFLRTLIRWFSILFSRSSRVGLWHSQLIKTSSVDRWSLFLSASLSLLLILERGPVFAWVSLRFGGDVNCGTCTKRFRYSLWSVFQGSKYWRLDYSKVGGIFSPFGHHHSWAKDWEYITSTSKIEYIIGNWQEYEQWYSKLAKLDPVAHQCSDDFVPFLFR